MPFPPIVAKFNRDVTNRVSRLFAGRIPPFAIIEHRGRVSGTLYRTPIMAFRSADGFVIALTYGAGSDWVRNIMAAGGCAIEYRRTRIALTEPTLSHDGPNGASLPRFVRFVLGLLHANEFLTLRGASE